MTTWAMSGTQARSAARLGTFYAAMFLVVGVQLPFWPVWLAGRGLGARQIAVLFAAGIWVSVAATPAIGALADRLGRPRAVMIVLAALACAAYAGLWPVAGFAMLLGLNLAAGVAQAALAPLADSVTIAAVREEKLDYGRIRVWGSISFIVASVGSGAAFQLFSSAAPAGNEVLLLVLAASAVVLACCLLIPRASAPGAARQPVRGAFGRLAGDRRFWLFVLSAAALQSSHQLYYGFGTLYWRQVGFSDAVIGALWAEGVIAEIVLFWYGRPLVMRLGPLGLMALGGLAGIVRWTLIGVVPGLGAAAALQLLHGLTFGANHLGAMHYMARHAPPEAATSAQSLYTALASGFGGLVMLAAGGLYAAYGGYAYPFMALLSAAGLAGVLASRRATARVRNAGEVG